MIDITRIEKIAALADYWTDKAHEAYARGDRAAYRAANAEIGRTLQPFERLTGRCWDWRLGGIKDKCWRRNA